MRIQPTLTLAAGAVLLTVAGCKELPEAPETLDELCAYVYEHHADEDPLALQTGLEQLTDWLEGHPDEALEGYTVDSPGEAVLDSLDDVDRTTAEMVGLAVTRVSQHPIEDSTHCLVVMDQSEIYTDTYDNYERSYIGDPQCFMDRECLRVDSLEHLESSFALGVKSTSEAHNQYLWVELERGWAMVHRNWQMEPPEVNLGWLEVDEQIYLNILMPGDDGIWRIQAQWTVYAQDNDVPEDLAANMVVDFLVKCHDDLEAWLDENDVP